MCRKQKLTMHFSVSPLEKSPGYSRGIFEFRIQQYPAGFCQVNQRRQIVGAILDTVLLSRRKSPAAMFQIIYFSAADNSLHEVSVDPHERDYEPDCEQPEISDRME